MADCYCEKVYKTNKSQFCDVLALCKLSCITKKQKTYALSAAENKRK